MTKKENRISLEGVEIPDWYLMLEPEIIEVLALEMQVKNRKEKLQTTILTMMEQEQIDSIKSDLTSSSRTAPTEYNKFDVSSFKKERPDEYKAYCKTLPRSGSVSLKWLKQPNDEAK